MDILATILLLFGIWLVVDGLVGLWRTRNLLFAWQFLGISLIRIPLEAIFYPGYEVVPMWSLLLGLLGTFGLVAGLTAAIISLLTDANAIASYIQAKQGRGLLAWLFCLYPRPGSKEKMAAPRTQATMQK